MAGFAGDDPFGFDIDFGDDGDNDPFCYDPFEDYGGDGDEGEGLIGGPLALEYGDGGEYCISGFAFLDGDGDGGDVLVGDVHAPVSSRDDEPILETIGRSFDSDGGLSQFYPHLISALELVEDTSGEEEDEEAMISENARGGSGFEQGAVVEEQEAVDDDDGGGIGIRLGGLTLDPRQVVEEAADHDEGGIGLMLGGLTLDPRQVVEEAADDDDGGIGLMLGELTLDPRPVVGGFEGLADAVEVATSEDDMGEVEVGRVGGLMLSGFDLAGTRTVMRPFRMVVAGEDTDSDDADWNLVDMLAGHVGEAAAARRLPASRAVVDGLPEVALSDEEAAHGCAVCKDGVAAGQSVLRLPCKHYFHGDCIRPWLAIRNTCPVCRFELPTGDADHDSRRSGRTGVVSVAQQSAPAQSGGTGAGSGAMVGAGDDATECSGENRPEQGTS